MTKLQIAELLCDVLDRVANAQALATDGENATKVAEQLNSIGGMLLTRHPLLGETFYNVSAFRVKDIYSA